jgi:hypothetical protein
MCVNHERTNFRNIAQNRGTFIKVVVFIPTHFVIIFRKKLAKKNKKEENFFISIENQLLL